MKPRIILAIPTGRPLKDEKLPKRVLALAREFQAKVPDFEIIVSHTPEKRPAHAVNLLINEFLATPENIWFVWLHNHEITASQLFALFDSGKPVCGALTIQGKNWDASFFPDVPADEKGILPIPELGVGVKIFHRVAFETIEIFDPTLHYVYDNSGRSIYAFCQESLVIFGEYKRLMSPASNLDMLCRKSKVGVFAHTGVILKFENEKEPYKAWMVKRQPPPVCAEDLPESNFDSRPIMVIIQYCDKDYEQASRLREKIRHDSGIEAAIHYSEGSGYPSGPNRTALALLRRPWGDDYRAVLLLEPDCCPTTPDWLDQLSRDWERAAAAGKLIMGSWHPINADHPTLGHINGNLMFSPGLAAKISIPDVPDDKPWDTYLADVFAPVWCRTGLIKNLNRHKTATVKQIEEPECGTRSPVLIHGVKDDSVWNYQK